MFVEDFEVVKRLDIARFFRETLCSGVLGRYSCDSSYTTENGILFLVSLGEKDVTPWCDRLVFRPIRSFCNAAFVTAMVVLVTLSSECLHAFDTVRKEDVV